MGKRSPSVGEPGYLPYCACPGLYRTRRGKDGFECALGRCGTSRIVNGIDMFDETAPDGPGYDWRAHAGAKGDAPNPAIRQSTGEGND